MNSVSDHLLVDHYNLGVKKFYEAMELVHKTNPQIAAELFPPGEWIDWNDGMARRVWQELRER